MPSEKALLKKLRDTLQNVALDVPLSTMTTIRIGGPAKFFFTANTDEDIVKAVSLARELGMPHLLLGSGANTLIADAGFPGLVIAVKNIGIDVNDHSVSAGAGVTIGQLVLSAVKQGLSGIECWAGIPGTVGGSIYGNMGLPSVEKGEIKDWLSSVTVFREGELKTLKGEECGFGYRDSVFKTTDGVIIRGTFILERSGSGGDGMKLMQEFHKKKVNSQPLSMPSSGCIFKNPKGDSAGRLIDEAGLKGRREGDAQISPHHANFIVNLGHAHASDVIMLSSLARDEVKNKFGIALNYEINRIGV